MAVRTKQTAKEEAVRRLREGASVATADGFQTEEPPVLVSRRPESTNRHFLEKHSRGHRPGFT